MLCPFGFWSLYGSIAHSPRLLIAYTLLLCLECVDAVSISRQCGLGTTFFANDVTCADAHAKLSRCPREELNADMLGQLQWLLSITPDVWLHVFVMDAFSLACQCTNSFACGIPFLQIVIAFSAMNIVVSLASRMIN